MKSWLSLLLALAAPAALLAQPTGGAETPGPAPAQKEPAAGAPAIDENANVNKMLQDLPEGQVFNGIHIPSLDPNGRLKSLFSAKTAKRIGDREIEMDGLKIEIHNDDGTNFHVAMEHSVFNFDTNILTSDTPTTIKRDDMVINGDSAEFNIKSRFGRMIGNVKMIIFNTGNTK